MPLARPLRYTSTYPVPSTTIDRAEGMLSANSVAQNPGGSLRPPLPGSQFTLPRWAVAVAENDSAIAADNTR